MNRKTPDFVIASSEGYGLEILRRCFAVKRLRGSSRDDLLLIRVEPPIVGQPYGLGSADIDRLIIAGRHRGEGLFPVRKWPVAVHGARALIPNPESRNSLADDELEEIAWVEIFETEAQARGETTDAFRR